MSVVSLQPSNDLKHERIGMVTEKTMLILTRLHENRDWETLTIESCLSHTLRMRILSAYEDIDMIQKR